ncbi:N-acetyltransferase [Luteimonas aestuarii]|uniref:N-acetyltransferase n=1 Tax=Luteimonas aestuarii TaxID=453837 RepID=A0A4R5TNV0_9GAMM|nr:GNAT family N-acetyltransferase [Luteimonas aestuarii]TDK22276.1 N-acetyltransferase [Luteimonas aestuarii]
MSGLRISTDPAELDIPMIHRFLSTQSTWANGIDEARVRRSIRHSLCFGGYVGTRQVAFARVVTDRTTFANLVDVFVLPPDRGAGHSKALVQAVMGHPDLQGLRRFTLATANAHGLYAGYGFASPRHPHTLMEILVPDLYAVPA